MEIQGLPAHPLLVHGPVVLIPLIALLGIAMIIRPSWRVTLGPWVILLAGFTFAVTFLASEAGEQLQAQLKPSELIRQHAELGDAMRPIVLALLLVICLLVLPARSLARGRTGPLAQLGKARWASLVIGGLVIAVGLLATYWVVQTGHSGADATWHTLRNPR